MFERHLWKLLLILCFPLTASAEPVLVASLSEDFPPGNIAISPEGRIFFSVHEFYGRPQKVVELKNDGSIQPYPNADWSSAPAIGKQGLNGVLGLNVDQRGILWLLDGATPTSNARLVAWNTRTEALHRVIYLGFPVTSAASFVNDLAIDYSNNAIYITDVATPETAALIVVDLSTGEAKRVLEGSQFTRPEDIDMVINDRVVTLGEQPARIGVNPITISPDNKRVYFGSMNGETLYRVETKYLADLSLDASTLDKRVERYGSKPISDGITIDDAGNVYVTSITDNSIGVTKPDGSYEPLFRDERFSWPDGFAIGPNNQVYFTVNELHKSPPLNTGKNETTGKFAIYRFTSLAEATVGR